MRFIVDECTGPAVARWLREQGHDVFSVYDDARGAYDDWVIALARSQKRILVTNDKDFGDKVFRDRQLHSGIVLLRLKDPGVSASVSAMSALLSQHSARLEGAFVVVTEKQVRFARL